MMVIGLTGSIGMGKTTTAELFREAGIPVFDADKAVHELYRTKAVVPIRDLYPTAVVDGHVDRKVLARLIADNPDVLQTLEMILHPMVREEELQFIANAEANQKPMVVLDIPLLFETGADKLCDFVIVVTAPFSVQRQRVMSRPDMTEGKFVELLNRQMPDTEKRQRADKLVFTDKGVDDARAQVRKIVAELLSRSH